MVGIIRGTICQMSLEKVEDIMARKPNEDLLIEDELAAAFLSDDDLTLTEPTAPASEGTGKTLLALFAWTVMLFVAPAIGFTTIAKLTAFDTPPGPVADTVTASSPT